MSPWIHNVFRSLRFSTISITFQNKPPLPIWPPSRQLCAWTRLKSPGSVENKRDCTLATALINKWRIILPTPGSCRPSDALRSLRLSIVSGKKKKIDTTCGLGLIATRKGKIGLESERGWRGGGAAVRIFTSPHFSSVYK